MTARYHALSRKSVRLLKVQQRRSPNTVARDASGGLHEMVRQGIGVKLTLPALLRPVQSQTLSQNEATRFYPL
jgi:hypothetical protein